MKKIYRSQRNNRLTRKARCVAIWIGQFSDEVELDDYLFFEFPQDFEVEPGEENQPEIAVRVEAERINDLLGKFSQADLFLDKAQKTATEKGIIDAKCAVVYYFSNFDDENYVPCDSFPLRFLGNIEW
jgi:hypothetical protein